MQGNIAVPVNDRPKFSAADVKAYGAKLSELAKWMADQGMTLAYHHHMGSFIESEDDVNALMEWAATLDGPAPRAQDVATGAWRRRNGCPDSGTRCRSAPRSR